MITNIITTKSYRKNREKLSKRGRKIRKLDEAVEAIKAHQLTKLKDLHPIRHGVYAGNMDCHIEGDWVLIWRYENKKQTLVLVDTGDHQMLFRESLGYYDDCYEFWG